MALSTCLSGEALRVYGRLTPVGASNYAKFKTALLKRFRFTVECFLTNLGRETPPLERLLRSMLRDSAPILTGGLNFQRFSRSTERLQSLWSNS